MTLPTGYRFFRDDALLDIRAKETLYCERCDLLYWKTDELEQRQRKIYETKGSYVGKNLCPSCISLIRSRINTLQQGKRKSCPIDSGKWIYSKTYHKICNDKDLFAKAKDDYDRQMGYYYTAQDTPAKTFAELKFKALLKKKGD